MGHVIHPFYLFQAQNRLFLYLTCFFYLTYSFLLTSLMFDLLFYVLLALLCLTYPFMFCLLFTFDLLFYVLPTFLRLTYSLCLTYFLYYFLFLLYPRTYRSSVIFSCEDPAYSRVSASFQPLRSSLKYISPG